MAPIDLFDLKRRSVELRKEDSNIEIRSVDSYKLSDTIQVRMSKADRTVAANEIYKKKKT